MNQKVQNRKKFGHAGGPIPATRVLALDLEHFQKQGIDGKSLIVINDEAGTFTAANVYDGEFGKNYDPSTMTHALPTGDALKAKMRGWEKKGYREVPVSDFDVLTQAQANEPTNV